MFEHVELIKSFGHANHHSFWRLQLVYHVDQVKHSAGIAHEQCLLPVGLPLPEPVKYHFPHLYHLIEQVGVLLAHFQTTNHALKVPLDQVAHKFIIDFIAYCETPHHQVGPL